MISNEAVRRKCRIAQWIGIAFGASVFIYGLIVFMVDREGALMGSAASDTVSLRTVLLGVSLVQILAIRYLKPTLLKSRSAAADGSLDVLGRLMNASITVMAICESLALYGFVIYFASAHPGDYYLFGSLSLAALYYYFPRMKEWRAYVEKEAMWET